jgi:hypothetical protein
MQGPYAVLTGFSFTKNSAIPNVSASFSYVSPFSKVWWYTSTGFTFLLKIFHRYLTTQHDEALRKIRSFSTPQGITNPQGHPRLPTAHHAHPPWAAPSQYVGSHIQIHLQWARAALALLPRHRCGVSIPLQGSALLAQREAAAVTHDTPSLGILPFAPDPHLLQHISADIYDLRAPVLTTFFLLFADDVCLVAPQPQLLHDLWQHIRVLHHAVMLP